MTVGRRRRSIPVKERPPRKNAINNPAKAEITGLAYSEDQPRSIISDGKIVEVVRKMHEQLLDEIYIFS